MERIFTTLLLSIAVLAVAACGNRNSSPEDKCVQIAKAFARPCEKDPSGYDGCYTAFLQLLDTQDPAQRHQGCKAVARVDDAMYRTCLDALNQQKSSTEVPPMDCFKAFGFFEK